MVTNLFWFHFDASNAAVREVAKAIGMQIHDLGGSWKDNPGTMRVAGNVRIDLERRGADQSWSLRAITRDTAQADLAEVARIHRQVRTLLASSAALWSEPVRTPVGAMEIPVEVTVAGSR